LIAFLIAVIMVVNVSASTILFENAKSFTVSEKSTTKDGWSQLTTDLNSVAVSTPKTLKFISTSSSAFDLIPTNTKYVQVYPSSTIYAITDYKRGDIDFIQVKSSGEPRYEGYYGYGLSREISWALYFRTDYQIEYTEKEEKIKVVYAEWGSHNVKIVTIPIQQFQSVVIDPTKAGAVPSYSDIIQMFGGKE
jgi:hypothetical protein